MININNFKKYVSKYDMKDKDIYLKYVHSIRTMRLCKIIGKKMKLNKKDLILISKIGLLHDIGRFNQLEKYHSYEDKKFNHAEEGVRVLFEKEEINKYKIAKEDYEVVKKAIYNHNKYAIEDNLSERELFFSKLIRDCDKLDILFRLAYEDMDVDVDNSKISKSAINNFNNKETVDRSIDNTNSDIILSYFCFVFDINYKESFQYLYESKTIDKLYEQINDKKYEKYYLEIKKYILEKVKGDENVR